MEVHNPQALENYIGQQAMNAAGAVHQIHMGQYPQYDENCRRDVGECLLAITTARERQLELDPSYPVGLPVHIAGLKFEHLPWNMNVGEVNRVRKFVVIPKD
jgi:hypothetical protein